MVRATRNLIPILFASVVLTSGPVANGATIEVPLFFSNIQDAISTAYDGDVILVSPGLYNEDIDFFGKSISVVSTDGAASTTLQGTGFDSVVRFVSGEGSTAILDGFTVTGGTAVEGGGIFCLNSSPTIRNCIVTGNTAQGGPVGFANGGGIACIAEATICEAILENNEIHGNDALSGGGIACVASAGGVCNPEIRNNTIHNNSASQGGGLITKLRVLTTGTVTARISNNEFFENTSTGTGGGLALWSSQPLVVNNRIHDNTGDLGGGIGVLEARPTIMGNLISNNHAPVHGGGLFLEIAYSAVVVNNTIAGNDTMGDGGGVFTNFHFLPAPFAMANNIIWGNQSATPGVFHAAEVPPSVFSNIITGGHPGADNLDSDPLFVDATANNYRLQGASPAIDAGLVAPGLPATDVDGSPRVVNSSIDLGAYEFQDVPFIRGDLNASGSVNLADGVALLSALFVPGTPPLECDDVGDANDDGNLNLQDPVYLLNAIFVPTAPPLPAPSTCGADPTPDPINCTSGSCP